MSDTTNTRAADLLARRAAHVAQYPGLAEEVSAILSDHDREVDLLTQAGMAKVSRVEHAANILTMIGAIGEDGTWQGLPDGWGEKQDGKSTFADIARTIVPQPEGSEYKGSGKRAKGEASDADVAYSLAVEAVQDSLKYAARTRASGYAPAKRPGATPPTPEEGEAEETTGATRPATRSDYAAVIVAELGKATVALDSGEGYATPDLDRAMVDAARAFVAAWDRATAEPVPPVTRSRKRTAASK